MINNTRDTSYFGASCSKKSTLVDQINDALSKAKYNEIDKMFTTSLKEMFRSDKPDSEFREFVLNHRMDGGLELMLPGAYYEAFKEH